MMKNKCLNVLKNNGKTSGKTRRNRRPADWVLLLVLCLFAFVLAYPFVYVLSASFTDAEIYFKEGIFLLPKKPTLKNFSLVFGIKNFSLAAFVSVTRTLLGTLVSVLLIAMLAFGLADRKLMGRRFFMKYFFLTTIFNGGIIPYVVVLQKLNLINNYWVYILPAIYSFFNMIIIRTAFEGIPSTIEEAAKLDGAGDTYIFFCIYMPLAKASLVVVAMYTAVFHWNDWFAGVYYVTNPKMKPLSALLQELVRNSSSGSANDAINDSVKVMAFTVLMILPIAAVYPFLQKYFEDGVTVGSIKE